MSYGIQLFHCPVCGRNHPLDTNSDTLADAHCTDNATSEIRQFRDVENPNALTQNNWNFDRANTKAKNYSNDSVLLGVKLNRPHPKITNSR